MTDVARELAKDQMMSTLNTLMKVSGRKPFDESDREIVEPLLRASLASSLQPQWVSVKERLPDSKRDVWVSFPIANDKKGVREARFDGWEWYGNNEDGEFALADYNFIVTHWTEFFTPPAPPTEQNEREDSHV